MSKIQKTLIREYASAATSVLTGKAIAYLEASKHTLSGDDSGLNNTWDEICVQIQGQESYFWDAYQSAMRDAILAAMIDLETRDKHAIWLQTERGWDWHYDVENGSNLDTEIPYSDDDLVPFLTQKLMELAGEFTNERITSYLGQPYD